ncbi:hypothetical protein V6N13_040422 [Hibiscus sabdariffa]
MESISRIAIRDGLYSTLPAAVVFCAASATALLGVSSLSWLVFVASFFGRRSWTARGFRSPGFDLLRLLLENDGKHGTWSASACDGTWPPCLRRDDPNLPPRFLEHYAVLLSISWNRFTIGPGQILPPIFWNCVTIGSGRTLPRQNPWLGISMDNPSGFLFWVAYSWWVFLFPFGSDSFSWASLLLILVDAQSFLLGTEVEWVRSDHSLLWVFPPGLQLAGQYSSSDAKRIWARLNYNLGWSSIYYQFPIRAPCLHPLDLGISSSPILRTFHMLRTSPMQSPYSPEACILHGFHIDVHKQRPSGHVLHLSIFRYFTIAVFLQEPLLSLALYYLYAPLSYILPPPKSIVVTSQHLVSSAFCYCLSFMDSELLAAVDNLQFTEEESATVITDAITTDEDTSSWLIGSVITQKVVDGEATIRIFRSVWKHKNIYGITKLRNDDLFAIEPYNPEWRADDYVFRYLPIWIRVYKLPLQAMNGEMGLRLGNCIGKALGVDHHIEGGNKGDFLGPANPCPLRYERLPTFCFYCGIIGHDLSTCTVKPNALDAKKLQYGSWLRHGPTLQYAPATSGPVDKESGFPPDHAPPSTDTAVHSENTDGLPPASTAPATSNTGSTMADKVATEIAIGTTESETEAAVSPPSARVNFSPPVLVSSLSPVTTISSLDKANDQLQPTDMNAEARVEKSVVLPPARASKRIL